VLRATYRQLQVLARQASRSPDADDLLHEALIAAISAGRDDMAIPGNRRWLYGTIRNKARMAARTGARSRQRDSVWSLHRDNEECSGMTTDTAWLAALPPGLKAVAALALSGHNRAEIAWLLHLEDAALRQRITQLRRRLVAAGLARPEGMPGLNLNLAYGRIREALLPLLRQRSGHLASHDPDGHLFVVRSSQN
jgi:DNA-directed RNA polymerase specialized sigma24 family protein